MLPGPLKLQVTFVPFEVKLCEPPNATVVELGVTVIDAAGVGVGVGGGVLLPPPHATMAVRTKQMRNAETILVIRPLHPLRWEKFL